MSPMPKVTLELREGYAFRVGFEGVKDGTFLMDEPAPLGGQLGPNASQMLAAALANCLSASLLFCLRKGRVGVAGMEAEAEAVTERNEDGLLRVSRVKVRLSPRFEGMPDEARTKKCAEIFERYCVVTAAVREGIRVDVELSPE
ncbi:MAG: OsmC family protein [Nitrososphaerota archaeon]|nr:OsmC family protein [Nitrososphaerota archaeon]